MDGLASLLDYRELTAVYAQAASLEGTPMTDEFFTNPVETGDEVQIISVGRSNVPAQGNTRGSMPRRLQAPNMAKSGASLFNSFNEMPVPFDKLQFLDSKNPEIQRVGRQYLDAAIAIQGQRQALFREAVIALIMTYGRVNLDVDGNVIVPSAHATTGALTDASGTVVSADFGIANSHRGRCQLTAGPTYVFSGAWDTTTTDIIAELDLLRDTALKAGAERPTTVYLHALRKQKLINNDKFKAWAVYNNMSNEAVLARNEFTNVWGWNFKFLEGYWTDSSGTAQPIIPVRQAIIVPERGGWKQCYEGLQRVPRSAGEIVQTFEQAMAATETVRGLFAFGQVKVTPLIQLSLFTGDNFGMGFPNANAVWQPTVFSA